MPISMVHGMKNMFYGWENKIAACSATSRPIIYLMDGSFSLALVEMEHFFLLLFALSFAGFINLIKMPFQLHFFNISSFLKFLAKKSSEV
jgi:hypothetical protein